MNKTYLLILICLLATRAVIAQKSIKTSGIILFEEKTNMHKTMEKWSDDGGEWVEQMKEKIPKYKVVNYELLFNNTTSVYRKSATQPPLDVNIPLWMRDDQKEPLTVVKDNSGIKAQKYILEQLFVIQDSLPKHQWKITDEFRTIAGYSCRRATTIIQDSVYVIAFYTDAIPNSTGPGSMCGLPGAILGVVIPKFHVMTFASEIKDLPEQVNFEPSLKGNKTNYSKATELINEKASSGWMKRLKNDFIWSLYF